MGRPPYHCHWSTASAHTVPLALPLALALALPFVNLCQDEYD